EYRCRIREPDVWRPRIDELRLRARRGDGFRVASLLEVRLRIGDGVVGGAQRLKAIHRVARARIAAARQGGGEAVRRRRVERLRGCRRAQQLDRFRILALLQIELPEVGRGTRVRRIDRAHAPERGDRVIDAIFGSRDQTEQVVGFGTSGQRSARGLELGPRRLRVAAIEQRDAEIQACDGEIRIRLQRLENDAVAFGKLYCSRYATPTLFARQAASVLSPAGGRVCAALTVMRAAARSASAARRVISSRTASAA